MNETAKKVVVVVVLVLAVGVAIFEGKNFVTGPPTVTKDIGHAAPGHGMKANEKDEEAAAKNGPPTGQANVDPLAGPGSK
jgi:hypothetical protein